MQEMRMLREKSDFSYFWWFGGWSWAFGVWRLLLARHSNSIGNNVVFIEDNRIALEDSLRSPACARMTTQE